VAAGINPTWYYSSGGSGNPHETLRLTGKVCSSEEFAGMARKSTMVGVDVWGNGSAYFPWSGSDKYYSKYRDLLGGWEFYKYGASKVSRGAKFFDDGTLMHYPVVDLSRRSCEPSLVVQGVAGDPVVDRHFNTLIRGNGLEIPTRCGKDMDKFIEDRVPRPTYPVIPETEVRPAVY